jgi:methylamine utilization protein MauE
MIHLLREVQVPFLGGVLLLACATKLVVRDGGPDPAATLPHPRSFVLCVALAEGTLGVALLVTPLGIVRLADVVFFATATSVVADLTRRGSEEGCGCFGGLSTTPAGRRGLARATLLMVAAIASAGVPQTGLEVLGAATAWSVVLIAAECALLLALSPELAVAVERTRQSTPCELRDVPLSETYATLYSSEAWREYEESLTSAEPSDVWRELCNRYVVYPARIDDRQVEVVFAVSVGGRRPYVRAGVVRDSVCEEQDGDSGSQWAHSPA